MRAAGDLVVDSWYVECGVLGSSSQQADWSDVVQNPYNETLTAALDESFSRTAHSFSWSADSALFDVLVSHHAEQLQGSTVTDGRIHVTPSVDSIVTAWGTWQYAWPDSAEGDTVLAFIVDDALTFDEVLSVRDYGGNLDLGPPHGTLTAKGSGVLVAGREYELIYFARVQFYSTMPPGTQGNASGELHFAITPLPEPATLALLAAAFLLARRRQH
jgi:hypothetical protein